MTLSTGNSVSLINRNFLLLTISAFLFFFNMHAFLLLPLWIKELGGSDSDIGFIMGCTSFSTIFSTPFAGWLVDRTSKIKLLVTGSILLAITSFPFVFLDTLNIFFYIFRILHGVSFSLFFVAAGTLITEVCPKEKRTQALGIFGVFTIINYAFAPYLGRKIVDLYSFDHFFMFISAAGFLTVAFIAHISVQKTSEQQTISTEHSTVLNILKRPGVIIPAVSLMFAGSGFIPTLSFLPVFSLQLGIEEFELFFIWYTISVLFIRLALGWLPDRMGKVKTVVPSLILFSVSIYYLGITTEKSDLIIAGILFGFGHGFLYPTLYSIVMDNSALSERGRVFSICSVAFTLGGMLGAFLYGMIAERFGYFYMYKLIAVICLAGFSVFIIYYMKDLFRLRQLK